MKEIEKVCVVYQAFDGKEFRTEKECEIYEREQARKNALNLKYFDIEFPMQDSYTSCRAYKINSENEFKMFQAYILDEYYEMSSEYCEYNGNGWYVVQGGDSGYADVYMLSDIIRGWNMTMGTIAKNVMDFE